MGSTVVRTPAAVEGAGQLLRVLREAESRTTTELAQAVGLARSTVLQRLELLRSQGLVEQQPAVGGARGRPAVQSKFNPRSGLVLAAQVGLTGSRLAVTDLAGEILAQRLITMDVAAGPERLLADLRDTFDSLLAEAGHGRDAVAGVGVGLPSAIELLTYARSQHLPTKVWDRDFFRAGLREHFGVAVFLDLDVNLLALAERGRHRSSDEVFVCVKLGTLIDAAIVVHGTPVQGAGGLAGELGHLKVDGSTVPCSCGSVGCLDAVASGNALVKQLAAAGFRVTHVSDVVALAQREQPEAVSAVRAAGRQIGEALASVVNLLNPRVIATWGYLTEAEAPLFAGIREGVYQRALPGSSEQLQIVRTALGDLAGVRGAALMVAEQLLEPHAVDRVIAGRSWASAIEL